MSFDAEILEAYDPCLGYDADNCPDQETSREMRVICFAESLERL
jgi:hypothetical protein